MSGQDVWDEVHFRGDMGYGEIIGLQEEGPPVQFGVGVLGVFEVVQTF